MSNARTCAWHPSSRYHCPLQNQCAAAWHLGFRLVVSINGRSDMNAQPRGISEKNWSRESALVQESAHSLVFVGFRLVVEMSTRLEMNPQPCGISDSCWWDESAPAWK